MTEVPTTAITYMKGVIYYMRTQYLSIYEFFIINGCIFMCRN